VNLARDPTTNYKGICLARRRMFKICGVAIWITLFAVVLTSVIRGEKINATPHAGQLHHTGKTQH
jgi:hypothetical protein